MATSKFYFRCNQCKYEWSTSFTIPRECPKCTSKNIIILPDRYNSLSLLITRYPSLSLFILRYHSLSFVITRYPSLSLVILYISIIYYIINYYIIFIYNNIINYFHKSNI